LTTGLPHRRVPELLAALCLVLLAMLLGLPTTAQGRRASCPSAAHLKHARHACTGATRSHRGHGRRASSEHRTGGQPAGAHAVTRTRAAGSGGPERVAASCDDGSHAISARQGALSCADGSEPRCEDGSSPARASAGAPPSCPTETESGAGEAVCEDDAGNACGVASEQPSPQPACADGGPALQRADGSSACGEDMAAGCTEGSALSFSSDGTSFVCTRRS
jgi:hypothetical protein